jgi:hypothetical protein
MMVMSSIRGASYQILEIRGQSVGDGMMNKREQKTKESHQH